MYVEYMDYKTALCLNANWELSLPYDKERKGHITDSAHLFLLSSSKITTFWDNTPFTSSIPMLTILPQPIIQTPMHQELHLHAGFWNSWWALLALWKDWQCPCYKLDALFYEPDALTSYLERWEPKYVNPVNRVKRQENYRTWSDGPKIMRLHEDRKWVPSLLFKLEQ